MDPRLEKVLEDVNHIHSINNQKRLLKEKYYEDRVIFSNGGKFTVTDSFIVFVKDAVSNGITHFIDDNDIPVEIEDTNAFYNKVIDTYKTATTEYYEKYNSLVEKSRNIEALLSI